ncbi:MAG TPA: EAL domain-containing protein, partial [Oscillospiraceae bacterium]|nr:EAL domain-containing protein [Oscillospiraceae bacterium]
SSLARERELNVNCLKIDKTFIDQINTSKKDSTIAGSIIDLVHNLDIKTVAEGVETENQFASLSSMKCDLIQGYLMSKPLNETQIIEFINDYKYTFRQ